MTRTIAPVVHKVSLRHQGSDFSFWQAQPYEARIAALEEIRREYQDWVDSQQRGSTGIQSRDQRVYRIVKR